MTVVSIKPNIQFKASIPAIVTLKERIAIGVLEINSHAARGALNSYQLTRDKINKLIDEYVLLRKLTIVKG